MQKFKLLILTDHINHSAENALYELARAMQKHPACEIADVATRGFSENDHFFTKMQGDTLTVSTVSEDFSFSEEGNAFAKNKRVATIESYDFIWLRLPPPLPKPFLDFIAHSFRGKVVVNNPKGIYEAGNKAFLMNFPEICAPMKLCHTVEEIIAFKENFPIILKPLRGYGGKGVLKIQKDEVWENDKMIPFDIFAENLKNQSQEYLAVKYLKNVTQGDKRIIVINGKIMGASLRLPPAGSWLCNVAMGGSSHLADIEEEEMEIIKKVDPILNKMGIAMYGVDTLMGDEGLRILSELNTTSIGGLPQIAKLNNQPLVEEAADLLWKYFNRKKLYDIRDE